MPLEDMLLRCCKVCAGALQRSVAVRYWVWLDNAIEYISRREYGCTILYGC